MNSKRLKNIFLFSLLITGVNVLFFISLGNVEFVTGGLYKWLGNFIGFLFILFQFIIHFPFLILIDYTYRRKSKKTELNYTLLWIYFAIAFIVNIIVILNATTESRGNLKNDSEWQNAEKFKWEEGVSSPKGYPVVILDGNFKIHIVHSNDPYYTIKRELYDFRWTTEGITTVSEFGDKRVIPHRLHLLWYSVTEKTYYEINTSIDNQKITTLFRNGYSTKRSDKITTDTYDYIIAGLTPGGDVAVWTRGNRGYSVEVGFYKAQKMDSLKISEYNRKEVHNQISNALLSDETKWRKILNTKQDTIPYGVWRGKYRQKYNWRFHLKSDKLEESYVQLDLFNGEKFRLINKNLSQDKSSMQAAPTSLGLFFTLGDKNKRIWIDFDEDSIYESLDLLSANDKKIPITIECILDKTGEIEAINAKTESKIIPLKIL